MWAEILLRLLFFAVIIVTADAGALAALRLTLARRRRRAWPARLVWGTTLAFLAFLGVTFIIHGMPGLDPVRLRAYYVVATVFLLLYGPKLILALPTLLESLLVFLARATTGILSRRSRFAPRRHARRRAWGLLPWFALPTALLTFFFLLDGVIGRDRFVIRNVTVSIPSLPAAFDGLRIAQFSDAHLGSFHNQGNVRRGLALIQRQRPDLIVFTGDLINSSHLEALPYDGWFRQLAAPMGKYAILGNHDMDDYMKWTDEKGDVTQPDLLEDFWTSNGFDLLRNQNVVLTRNGDSLVLAGVDNWGLPPFRQEGDLRQALEGTGALPVLLLSHDPSHWHAEVLAHERVLLTLSGHTHAMQFAIPLPGGGMWSPSEWLYPEWGGLYEHDGRFLHVNPGFGYIGFLLRAGTRPEITLIELRRGEVPRH